MAFELTDAAAKLSSVTPRTERHGEDEVFAISLGFKLTTANTILDRLSPTLRDALYKAVEGQTAWRCAIPTTAWSTRRRRSGWPARLRRLRRRSGWASRSCLHEIQR